MVFYRSFYEAIVLQPKKIQADIYNAICDYALNGNEPKITGIALSIFRLAKPQIDANNERYVIGKKGGRPKKIKTDGFEKSEEIKTDGFEKGIKIKTDGFENPPEKSAFKKPNVNVNDNVNDNVIFSNEDKAKSVKRFVAPTLAEIQEYCKEKGFNVDAASIYDHYTANGWVQGKNKPIKDWKAAVRQWARREGEFSKPQPQINNDARRGGFDDVAHNSGDDYEGMF